LGFPSTLDKERATVINTPNVAGFNHVPIKAIYEEALGIPVFINKDATLLLYYDLHFFKLNLKGIIAGIYIGTGIGNSILIDGKELTGNDGVACELGHFPVSGREDECSCGLRGCIELYAGGKGLERIHSSLFAQSPIEEVFTRHADTPQIQGYIGEIANTVVTEINILNPKCVILGGGVLHMNNFPQEYLIQQIRAKTRKPIPGDSVKLYFSNKKDPYNGVIGAALYGYLNKM
jgi:allose kinase